MFQFRGLAPFRVLGLLPNGLSHSEISGSRLVCKSPELIAAYHVLHRLQEPRHPPYALNYFLYSPCSLLSSMAPYLISLIVSMNDANFHLRSSTLRFRSSTPFAMLKLRLRVEQLKLPLSKAPERRCSSRTFRYGYLVTT